MALYGMILKFDLKCICSSSGPDAVRLFQKKLEATCCNSSFRLVLTDIQMPDMDGYRVAECIRATEYAFKESLANKSAQGKYKTEKNCSIIAVTAFTNDIEANTKKVGIEQVIRKPVDQAVLKKVLKKCIL